jgi:hypothetical protein
MALMLGHICEHERASRKMPGRKMKTARAVSAIFLPGIFLLYGLTNNALRNLKLLPFGFTT